MLQASGLVSHTCTHCRPISRSVNEFLYMTTLPALDACFRNPETGQFKEILREAKKSTCKNDPRSFTMAIGPEGMACNSL